jgi:hypothetical protein
LDYRRFDGVPDVLNAKLIEVGGHIGAMPPLVSLDQMAGSDRSIALLS